MGGILPDGLRVRQVETRVPPDLALDLTVTQDHAEACVMLVHDAGSAFRRQPGACVRYDAGREPGGASMAAHAHKKHAVRSVSCAVVTVSDTRSMAEDTSGRRIVELLGQAGHVVTTHEIVRDDPPVIEDRVRSLVRSPTVQAVILNGGTGLTPRDGTYEVVREILEKEISGFGELFRYLSYSDIGPAAMLSRATAGVAEGKIVISVPGSTAAVELAMAKLILPELGHMVFLAGTERG